MNPRIGLPPLRLRKARLDNLALMPASALAQIAHYQALANELPDGGVLMVLPVNGSKQKTALSIVAKLLTTGGHHVRLVSAVNPSKRAEISLCSVATDH